MPATDEQRKRSLRLVLLDGCASGGRDQAPGGRLQLVRSERSTPELGDVRLRAKEERAAGGR
ncbi:MAG: hypothetical protein ACXVH3_34675 [Solirubrobacteraceae bacterium]